VISKSSVRAGRRRRPKIQGNFSKKSIEALVRLGLFVKFSKKNTAKNTTKAGNAP